MDFCNLLVLMMQLLTLVSGIAWLAAQLCAWRVTAITAHRDSHARTNGRRPRTGYQGGEQRKAGASNRDGNDKSPDSNRHDGPQQPPSVLVLKPLCGVDPGLQENLATFAAQTQPPSKLLFGIARNDDAAAAVAQRFCRKQRQLKAALQVGESPGMLNPKVALLERLSQHNDCDWLVISDSNVRVRADYLEEALGHAVDPRVGLITHLVAGNGGETPGAHCENLQLNCFIAPAAAAARLLLGRTCVIGKSIFIRRDALRALGGFRALGQYLAEDFVMGRELEKLGYALATSNQPIVAWHDGWSLQRFLSRHLRWAVMRRRVSPAAYALEGLLNPLPWALLLALLTACLQLELLRLAWLLPACAAKYALDALTYSRVAGVRIPLSALWVAPLRDVLAFGIWSCAWFMQVVEWRGRLYRVTADTVLEPLVRGAAPSWRPEPASEAAEQAASFTAGSARFAWSRAGSFANAEVVGLRSAGSFAERPER